MSFTAPSRERSGPVLPLASMIDVLFLLLIFFLTSSVMREQELQMRITLPASSSADPSETRRAPIVVTIDAQGELFMGERAVTLDELRDAIQTLVAEFPQETMLVRADTQAPTGSTIAVIDMGYAMGLADVRLGALRSE